jgi:hypothetical protein
MHFSTVVKGIATLTALSGTAAGIDRNILCLNGLIKLGVGNVMHRGLLTEQGIWMNPHLNCG